MANFYVWRAVLAASVGAVLAGLHIGSINGMFEMHGFQSTFPQLFEQDNCSTDPVTGTLSSMFENVTAACGICFPAKSCGGSGAEASSILGLMISISNFGAAFGAILGGWSSTVIGRRQTLCIAGLIMALGSLLSAVSFHSWLFIIGRGISGFSMGLSYGILALYISEISPKKSRGKLASIIGPVYGLSLVFQFGANCGFSYFCLGWRISLVMQIVTGLGYVVIMLLLPRTPRWLALYSRNGEAHLVLSRINGLSTDNSVLTLIELKELKSTTSELPSNYFKSLAKQFSITVKWRYFKRLLLCTVLFIFTPLLGNFTYYFGNTFFCKLNIDPCSSNTIVGLSLLLGGVIMSLLMDKAGRKLILLVGTLLMLLLQALMTALIQVFNLQEEENDVVGYVLTALFCAYAFVYSGSWLTTPWVISSEIFPVETRGLCVAISTGMFWLSATSMTQMTPIIIDSVLGIAGFMCLLIGFTVIAFIAVLFGLPETKGVSLERMDELFDSPWLERVNLAYYSSCGISTVCKMIQPQEIEETYKSTEDVKLEKTTELI